MAPRAFLIEPARFDSSNAEKFGRIVTIYQDPSQHVKSTSKLFTRDLMARLRDYGFRPDKDYVVLTGKLRTLLVTVAAIAVEYGPFNGLVYDGSDAVNDYVHVIMGGGHREECREECVC